MLVRFADRKLERLETGPTVRAGFGPDVVKQFRRKMAIIRAATGERALYASKSLDSERLKGGRSHQRSMRLNDQFRLIVEIETVGERVVVVVSVDDYH